MLTNGLITEREKADDLRVGRVFVDWSQNDEHKATVCAYSLRARPALQAKTPQAELLTRTLLHFQHHQLAV